MYTKIYISILLGELYYSIIWLLQEPLRPSAGSGTVNLGSTNVPQTSSDAIPEKVGIDGVHDDRGEDVVGKKGDDVDEDDVTITKVQV